MDLIGFDPYNTLNGISDGDNLLRVYVKHTVQADYHKTLTPLNQGPVLEIHSSIG